MQSIIIGIVLKILTYFFEREVLANHPIMLEIMHPKPLKPDENPPLSQINNPNVSKHYGGL